MTVVAGWHVQAAMLKTPGVPDGLLDMLYALLCRINHVCAWPPPSRATVPHFVLGKVFERRKVEPALGKPQCWCCHTMVGLAP